MVPIILGLVALGVLIPSCVSPSEARVIPERNPRPRPFDSSVQYLRTLISGFNPYSQSRALAAPMDVGAARDPAPLSRSSEWNRVLDELSRREVSRLSFSGGRVFSQPCDFSTPKRCMEEWLTGDPRIVAFGDFHATYLPNYRGLTSMDYFLDQIMTPMARRGYTHLIVEWLPFERNISNAEEVQAYLDEFGPRLSERRISWIHKSIAAGVSLHGAGLTFSEEPELSAETESVGYSLGVRIRDRAIEVVTRILSREPGARIMLSSGAAHVEQDPLLLEDAPFAGHWLRDFSYAPRLAALYTYTSIDIVPPGFLFSGYDSRDPDFIHNPSVPQIILSLVKGGYIPQRMDTANLIWTQNGPHRTYALVLPYQR